MPREVSIVNVRSFFHPDVWSNAAFLVPLSISVSASANLFTIALALLFLFSTAHHISKNKTLRYADEFFAYVLICLNLYIAVQVGITPHISAAILLALIALYLYHFGDKQHKYYHALWHGSSATITVLCLLSNV